MARQRRLHVPHATYYVVDQFSPGLEVLVGHPGTPHTPADLRRITANREQFEAQLTAVTQRWGAHVDAHCWLPDAALLILKISLASLECTMHSLHSTFSHHLHAVAGIRTRPYPSRYRALLLDPQRHLLDFTRHMLATPFRTGLAKNAVGYAYCSLSTWYGNKHAPFLAHSRVPDALAHRGIVTRDAMERFLADHPRPGFPALLRHGSRRDNRIAGTDHFVREVQQKAEQGQHAGPIAPSIEWAARFLDLDLDTLTNQKGAHDRALIRALAAWLITSSGAASLSETARRMPCRKSTLHDAIMRYSLARPDLFSETTLARYAEFMAAASTEQARNQMSVYAIDTSNSAS